MSSLVIEPEFESRTSFDFDSAILLDLSTPTNEDEEIVIGGRISVSYSTVSHESICEKWKAVLSGNTEIVVSYFYII